MLLTAGQSAGYRALQRFILGGTKTFELRTRLTVATFVVQKREA